MDSKVLVHICFKEGTGRSTMNAVFAFLLGRMKESTLFVDLDPSTTATQILMNTYHLKLDPEKTIYKGLTKEDLISNTVAIDESLSFIPGDWRLNLWNPSHGERSAAYSLTSMLMGLHRQYKYILLDVPSNSSLITDTALIAASNIFLTLENHKIAYIDFGDSIRYLADSKNRLTTNYAVSGVVLSITRGNPTSKLNQKFIFDAKKKFHSAILSNPQWYQERVHSFTENGITFKDTWDMRVLTMYQNILNEELTRIEG